MAEMTPNLRGALYMMGAMTAFTLNDAFMKALGDDLPLFQILFLRGIGATFFLWLLSRRLRQLDLRCSARDWRLMALRALAEMAGSWFFISALFVMPFADLSAILQALPLTVTLAAALVLGERLAWRRMTAILIGFGGVLLILRPTGEGVSLYALYGVATVVCVTVRDIASRMMSPGLPSLTVAFTSALGVTLFAGAGSLFEDWRPVSGIAAVELLGAMVFLMVGYVLAVSATRVGEIGFVAPFRYTSLVVALIVGLAVFGTFPDALTLLGAAIVVATGLYTLYRERQLRRTSA